MARSEIMEEVRVLRFFEAGPIDKVEAVFHIVCDKMHERLRERTPGSADVSIRKRRSRTTAPQPEKENMERADSTA